MASHRARLAQRVRAGHDALGMSSFAFPPMLAPRRYVPQSAALELTTRHDPQCRPDRVRHVLASRGPAASDASLDGYAAVLCTEVTCQVLAKRKVHASINQAELYALYQAVCHFFHQLRASNVVIHMDSQVGLCCIEKRFSPVYALDNLVNRIWARLDRCRPTSVRFEKIPSKLNPADAPSRDRPIDEELPSVHGLQYVPLDHFGGWHEYGESDGSED